MKFFRFCLAIAKGFAKIMYRLTVEGLENIPTEGRAVLVANHTKNVDPGIIAVAIKRPFCAMGKKELFSNRFVAFILRALGAVPVNREAPGREIFETMVDLVKQEKLVLIFPEGTRTADQSKQLENVKSGAVVVSVMGRAPMIPIVIIAPDGIKFGKSITIRIGKPIQYHEFGVTEFRSRQYKYGAELMVSRMKELRGDIPDELYAG